MAESFAVQLKKMAVLGCLFVAAPVVPQVVHGTGPLPSYEVATIKPNQVGAGRITPLDSAEISSHTFGTARMFVQRAYMPFSPQDLIFGGPGWIDKQMYILDAKMPAEIYTQMQHMHPDERRKETALMMQSLMADRFKLKVHFETRRVPVYELVVARGGLKITKNDDDFAAGSVGMFMKPGQEINFSARNSTMQALADGLQGAVTDRPVVDKTGVAGNFTFRLNFSPEGTVFDRHAAPAVNATDPMPSFFSAIQDVGLRLVPAVDPVEVVVIDHIELPTEN